MREVPLPPMTIPDRLDGMFGLMDSNVLYEAVSFSDINAAYLENESKSPKFFYRLRRLRETLILLEYLHRNKLTTFSLRDEYVRKLAELVPADRKPTEHTEHLWVAMPFLIERIFQDWTGNTPEDGTKEPEGNAADDFLLKTACKHALPIITNEGSSIDGTIARKNRMQRHARCAGVTVLRPADVWKDKIDPADACASILDRVRAQRAAFEASTSNRLRARAAIDAMLVILTNAFKVESRA